MAEILGRELLSGEPRIVIERLNREASPEGLTAFGNREQRVTVLFVHGLKGRKFTTWHDFPRLIALDESACAECQIAIFLAIRLRSYRRA